jgi:hypothetical protein
MVAVNVWSRSCPTRSSGIILAASFPFAMCWFATQWSDPVIARTTPALPGLFSLITLWAHDPYRRQTPTPRGASWYYKALPTFSDALAAVRREIWAQHDLQTSSQILDVGKLSSATVNNLINVACYAA